MVFSQSYFYFEVTDNQSEAVLIQPQPAEDGKNGTESVCPHENNAVAGLSMGRYGAVRQLLQHPESFVAGVKILDAPHSLYRLNKLPSERPGTHDGVIWDQTVPEKLKNGGTQ